MYDRRFSNLPWYEKAKTSQVLVAGLGGVGSWLALFLARANVHVHGCDHDTVDDANLGGQLYSRLQIGKTKVRATKELLQDHCPNGRHSLVYSKYGVDSFPVYRCNAVFSCVDDMEVRAQLFDDFIAHAPEDAIFIDSRMGAENFYIYAVTKDRREMYKETLFASSEAIDEGCTTRATSHCGATCASFALSLFLNHICEQDEWRDVPFVTKVILPNMLML